METIEKKAGTDYLYIGEGHGHVEWMTLNSDKSWYTVMDRTENGDRTLYVITENASRRFSARFLTRAWLDEPKGKVFQTLGTDYASRTDAGNAVIGHLERKLPLLMEQIWE